MHYMKNDFNVGNFVVNQANCGCYNNVKRIQLDMNYSEHV